MKINEIINETEEHINLYWLLKNINIKEYYNRFNRLRELSKVSTNPLIKSDLISLYSFVDDLLRNSDWQYVEKDSDYDKIYDGLLTLLNDIKLTLGQK